MSPEKNDISSFSRSSNKMQPAASIAGLAELQAAVAREEVAAQPAAQSIATAEPAQESLPEDDSKLTYPALLAKHKIDPELARIVLDAVLTKGYYQEDSSLTARFNITLRSRTTRDGNRVSRTLADIGESLTPHRLSRIVNTYNLAASLVRYGSINRDRSPVETEEQFQDRINFIETLGDMAFSLASNALVAFDRKLSIIFSEGCQDFF